LLTRPLGRSGLQVGVVSLGTMTFGEQNDRKESFAIMDLAFDHGVDHLDAAELYPIAPRPETQGRTEELVGAWLAERKRKNRVTVATKVVGHSPAMPWFRGAGHRLDRTNIRAALDTSLKRLGMDRIDLYYLHWPDRTTNTFGKLGYRHDPDAAIGPLEDGLEALDELVRDGRIRAIGISNETPWGMHRYLHLAETRGWPRIACIQNPYSLLNRTFEVGLAEMAIREEVPLMGYSPLGGGVLTGKYLDGARPEGARLTRWPDRYGRYTKPRALAATEAYVHLARRHRLDPAQMALAWTLRQPFLASAIVGATSTAQLANDLKALDLTLSDHLLEDVETLHDATPYPAP